MSETEHEPQLDENIFEEQVNALLNRMGPKEFGLWIYNHNKYLETIFPRTELVKYRFWHVFVGGSPGSVQETPYIDLPGEHSLGNLVASKLKEYESKS